MLCHDIPTSCDAGYKYLTDFDGSVYALANAQASALTFTIHHSPFTTYRSSSHEILVIQRPVDAVVSHDFLDVVFCLGKAVLEVSGQIYAKISWELKAMQTITLNAHFDGKQILLDEPYELEPNTKLVVSVIGSQNGEREEWTRFSLVYLERAYGDDEPEYSLDLIKEPNPKYEGR